MPITLFLDLLELVSSPGINRYREAWAAGRIDRANSRELIRPDA